MSNLLPSWLKRSFQISTLVLLVAACGREREVPLVSHPAEEMRPKGVESPSVSASAQEGCQDAVVVGSNHEHLCCSELSAPPRVEICSSDWVRTKRSCVLSFQEPRGKLWRCEKPAAVAAPAEPESAAESEVDAGSDEDTPSATELPAPIVHDLKRSARSERFRLHQVAEALGLLEQERYLSLQFGYVQTRIPACNYFLITALCESSQCNDGVPWLRAAEFDSYFRDEGWTQLTLDQLKAWFVAGVAFDSVLQKEGVTITRPGHVAIPIGLGAESRLYVAQGSLGTVTNQVKSVSDGFILSWNGGFRIFAKAN